MPKKEEGMPERSGEESEVKGSHQQQFNKQAGREFNNQHQQGDDSVLQQDQAGGMEQAGAQLEQEKVLAKIAELEEMNRKLTVSLAYAQNDAKMTEKKAEEKVVFSLSGIARDMTQVVNTLSLAIASMKKALESKEEQAFARCVEGVEMTMKVLISQLLKHNIQVIGPAKGDEFDSTLHEAISVVGSDQPKNKVVDVLQMGSSLNGRLIVPAKVVVSGGENNS